MEFAVAALMTTSMENLGLKRGLSILDTTAEFGHASRNRLQFC